MLRNPATVAWRLDEDQPTPLAELANQLQLTSFAITKIMDEDRVISWLRVANSLSVKPPPPDLPDTSMYVHIRYTTGQLKGIWLDIANIFHNLGYYALSSTPPSPPSPLAN